MVISLWLSLKELPPETQRVMEVRRQEFAASVFIRIPFAEGSQWVLGYHTRWVNAFARPQSLIPALWRFIM